MSDHWPVREVNSVIDAYRAQGLSWREMRRALRAVVPDPGMMEDDEELLESMWQAQGIAEPVTYPQEWEVNGDPKPFIPLTQIRQAQADEAASGHIEEAHDGDNPTR